MDFNLQELFKNDFSEMGHFTKSTDMNETNTKYLVHNKTKEEVTLFKTIEEALEFIQDNYCTCQIMAIFAINHVVDLTAEVSFAVDAEIKLLEAGKKKTPKPKKITSPATKKK